VKIVGSLKAIVCLVGNKLVYIRQVRRKCTILKLQYSLHYNVTIFPSVPLAWYCLYW